MFEPDAELVKIVAATEGLLVTAAGFQEAELREASLLPGWTRGHVLTHVARNADGGTRLLDWARTGVESYEYPSMEARAAEIEEGAGRDRAALLADVEQSAQRFSDAYRRMPSDAWQRVVRWTSGAEFPAERAADARLCEVLVHHVDLRGAFRPSDWPADFVTDMLGRAVASFAKRRPRPTGTAAGNRRTATRETSEVDDEFARRKGKAASGYYAAGLRLRLHATDTDARYELTPEADAPVVSGPQTELLAWLMGRTDGSALSTEDGKPPPSPPFLY